MKKFKIDEVAKECGLTKRTLRYYEEIGLLPSPERSEGGIRLYTQDHIDQLKRLIDARDVLGFSLQELQKFLSIKQELDTLRQGYRESSDEREKQNKLKELEPVLAHQLDLMDQKLRKMNEVRATVEDLYVRVKEANKRNQQDS